MPKKQHPSEHMIRRARNLRRAGTPPEQLLWSVLRNCSVGGMKFRRQHPIGPYVVDFYCHESKLVVEIDGMSHDNRVAEDAARTHYLESLGLQVLRVMNEDVMQNLDAVAREIAHRCGVQWD